MHRSRDRILIWLKLTTGLIDSNRILKSQLGTSTIWVAIILIGAILEIQPGTSCCLWLRTTNESEEER